MFCQKCGALAPEESNFCLKCGCTFQEKPKWFFSNRALLLAGIAALISAGSFLFAFLPRGEPIKAQAEPPIIEASPSPSPSATPKPIVTIETPKSRQTPEPEIEKKTTQLEKELARLKENLKPEPTPRPQRPRWEPQTKMQTIASGSYTIEAGRFFAFPINIGDWTNPVVMGSFNAAGGMRNNIEVYIVDEDGLTNRKNGNSASAYYNAGRVTTGRIHARLPPMRPGRYYLVVDNSFAIMLQRTVRVYAAVTYSE